MCGGVVGVFCSLFVSLSVFLFLSTAIILYFLLLCLFQNDIQLELAHVLTDIRAVASCDGIVGTFDSGITEQMIITSCNLSKLGRCGPSVDLREIYKDYG